MLSLVVRSELSRRQFPEDVESLRGENSMRFIGAA